MKFTINPMIDCIDWVEWMSPIESIECHSFIREILSRFCGLEIELADYDAEHDVKLSMDSCTTTSYEIDGWQKRFNVLIERMFANRRDSCSNND